MNDFFNFFKENSALVNLVAAIINAATKVFPNIFAKVKKVLKSKKENK